MIKLLFLSILSAASSSENIFTTGEDNTFCSLFRVKRLRDAFTNTNVTIAYRSTNTTLTVRMNTTAKGYIGFAHSSNQLMEGSEAVIGFDPNSNNAKKFRLGSYFAEELGAEQQTLMNTTFLQNEDGGYLEFTKLLEDGDDVADKKIIDGSGPNDFIWAVGRNNNLQFHQAFGTLELTLSPFCTGEEVDDGEVLVVVKPEDYKTFFVIHGMLAVLAFGLFIPVAVTASRARSLFDFEFQKKKAWYVIHSGLNTLAYMFTVILFALVCYAYQKKEKEHFKTTHEIVGLITFILMTLQVVAAVFRPDAHPPSKKVVVSTVYEDSQEDSQFESEKETEEQKVRLVRKIWQKSHILVGVGTLGCGLYQLHSGLTLYQTLFLAQNLVTSLWVTLGCVFAILAATIVHSMRTK